MIVLNQGWLLCVFYAGEISVGSVHFQVQNSKAIYDDGWRLDTLKWLIETYEPRVKLP